MNIKVGDIFIVRNAMLMGVPQKYDGAACLVLRHMHYGTYCAKMLCDGCRWYVTSSNLLPAGIEVL